MNILNYFALGIFSLALHLLSHSGSKDEKMYVVAKGTRYGQKIAYVSQPIEVPDLKTSYSDPIECGMRQQIILEVGSEGKSYVVEVMRTYMGRPMSFNDAKSQRTKIITDLRSRSYSVVSVSVDYDPNACN